MRDMDRLLRPTSDTSDVRLRSFALSFLGLLCAMAIGFVSEIRPLRPDSPDYGYDESLGTETSSLSSANLPANGSDGSRATVGGRSKDSLDRLEVGLVALRAANRQLHVERIGGDRAE
jgi:hypothetical protein